MSNFSPITWSCHPQMNLVRSEYDRLSTFFRQSNAKPVIIPIILKSRIHVPPIIQFSIRHTPFFFINLTSSGYPSLNFVRIRYFFSIGQKSYPFLSQKQNDYNIFKSTVVILIKSWWGFGSFKKITKNWKWLWCP